MNNTYQETTIEKIIQKAIIKSYEKNEHNCIFDLVMKDVESWYDRPAHDLVEMRLKESKKEKGDHFELLCQLYLKNNEKYDFQNVWLLSEVPSEILQMMSMKRKDFGIDLVCQTKSNKFIAVQAKYRKIGRKKSNVITWKMLSTFYALCLKTGPWEKYIVITNADYVTHMGKKTKKDQSICIGTWKKIKTETWLKMSNVPENVIKNEPENVPENVIKNVIKNENESESESKIISELEWIRKKRLEKFN
jgi:predicted helicase